MSSRGVAVERPEGRDDRVDDDDDDVDDEGAANATAGLDWGLMPESTALSPQLHTVLILLRCQERENYTP
jgi:hypothetical protein